MPRELPWKLEENTRIKPASQLTFGARRWPLSLGGLVEQFRQVLGSQRPSSIIAACIRIPMRPIISLDFLSVFKGKSDGLLTCFKLKDPGAVPDLIAMMELGVIRGSIHPHSVNDFEPAVRESP